MSQASASQESAAKPAQDAAGRPAYTSRAAIVLFAATAIIGTAADLLTKHWVFSSMPAGGRGEAVVPGLFRFSLTTNPGIVFGILLPPLAVLGATLCAAFAVIYLFATSPRRAWSLHLALGMVIGGAAGNAYDRLFSAVQFVGENKPRVGQVRDFIEFIPRLQNFSWPVFNVADILLVAGVGLIMLYMLRHGRKAK